MRVYSVEMTEKNKVKVVQKHQDDDYTSQLTYNGKDMPASPFWEAYRDVAAKLNRYVYGNKAKDVDFMNEACQLEPPCVMLTGLSVEYQGVELSAVTFKVDALVTKNADNTGAIILEGASIGPIPLETMPGTYQAVQEFLFQAQAYARGENNAHEQLTIIDKAFDGITGEELAPAKITSGTAAAEAV